jgi:hypothetical protein
MEEQGFEVALQELRRQRATAETILPGLKEKFTLKIHKNLGRDHVLFDCSKSPIILASFLGHVKAEGFLPTPLTADNYQGQVTIKLTPDPVGSLVEGRLARVFREAREEALKNIRNFCLGQLIKRFDYNLKYCYSKEVMFTFPYDEDRNDPLVLGLFIKVLHYRGFVVDDSTLRSSWYIKPSEDSNARALQEIMNEMGVELFPTVDG